MKGALSVVAGVTAAAILAGLVVGPARDGDALVWRGLRQLELWSLDARFVWRGPRPATGEVVVVAIDDATRTEAPDLIEKRAGIAAVVGAIKRAGATVIGIDAFFAMPESPLDEALSKDVRAVVDGDGLLAVPEPIASILRRIREETRGDEVLAAALEAARPVVLAAHATADGAVLDPAVKRRARFGQVAAGSGRPPPESSRLLSSMPALAIAAGHVGLATVDLDTDEMARRVAVARVHDDAILISFAAQVAARHLGVPPAAVGYLPDEGVALGANRIVPTSAHSMLLNHRGKDAFTVVSAARVVAGEATDILRGKAVLLGFTYLSHDIVPTPFNRWAPGVLVHANAVDNLLAGDPLRRASRPLDALLVLMAGLLAAIVAGPLGPRQPALRIAGLLVVGVVVGGVAGIALDRGVWVALAGPTLAVGLAGGTTLVVAYATEGLEKRRLRQAFSHYMAPELVSELVENPAMLALGGARRDATLLFSDIRGFTTVSEAMSPEDLVRFLNSYLTPMTGAVLAERGFVDKYIGDAIMAVFGAPAASADHATRAVSAALRMHQALIALRSSLRADLDCGVGLNSGAVVAGNMGSAERFDYTVIGDAVNLASRLEGLTKRYGVFCICGEDTVSRVDAGAGFAFRSLDLVRVKGRGQPVAIFELLAGPGHAIARYVEVAVFEAAVAAFRRGAFADARSGFTAFGAANPDDRVTAMYLARLDVLASSGDVIPAGFDGVFDHTEK